MPSLRRARVNIDLNALRHNLQQARQYAGNSRVMAVIKANAYGHGMLKVAKALDQADGFAVATLSEAVALREAGISVPVLVLEGACNVAEVSLAAAKDITLSVHHESQLQDILSITGAVPPLWLKLDTGMHRLGFPAQRFFELSQRLGTRLEAVMMHFACADEPDHPQNQAQYVLFETLTGTCGLPRSAANSAALLRTPQSVYEWVRPGIMLYGSSPLVNESAAALDLLPVMTLTAPLIAINTVSAGERIGYGGSYTADEEMRVGVIAIGYADGYPRHAPSGTPVLICGKECPLAGRVSMDMLTVNLRHCPEAEVGDEVTLWGEGLSVDRIAAAAGTIGYELLCAAGRAVPVLDN